MVIKESNMGDIRYEVTEHLESTLQDIYDKYNVSEDVKGTISMYVEDIAETIINSAKQVEQKKLYNLNNYNIPGLGLKLQQYYRKYYPSDTIVEEIPAYETFKDLLTAINNGDSNNVYYLCANDSVVRERLFEKLADILGVSYEIIYNKFINPNKFKESVNKQVCRDKTTSKRKFKEAVLRPGDKVKYRHAGGVLSNETGTVLDVYKDPDIGKYDFCTIEWPDGEVSNDVDCNMCVKVKPYKYPWQESLSNVDEVYNLEEDIAGYKAYKNELEDFANEVKEECSVLAYKNGYQLHYKPYFRQTNVNGRYLTAICLDLDEVKNTADMNKLDKALQRYFRNSEYKFVIEELPRVKRICIYK